MPTRPAEPEDEEDDGAAEREAEERAAAERAEQEAREARELKERQAQEQQRAKAAAAAAERKRKEKEKLDREEREREREEQARREKEGEDEEAAEETRHVADDKQSTKSAPRTVRSPKPEGRKSVEKRGCHLPAYVLFLVNSSLGAPPDPTLTREWRDRTGQFRVEAAFLGYKNGVLRLHKKNGVVIEVPSEKMSAEDMRYVEKMSGRGSSASRKGGDEDDEPLSKRRQSLQSTPAPTKKAAPVDWFEFFLNAGCDVDDCTRYASSFERDKIDEAILPDITEGTLRTLGLREGDIIRVNKAIDARRPKPPAKQSFSEVNSLGGDEAGTPARATPSPGPPNLFTGPGGQLKNARRGRPTPSKAGSTPGAVDLTAISTASEQIARSSTPLMTSPTTTPAPPALVTSPAPAPPPRSNSAIASGFDDDAWTNRPSSTKPVAPTPPIPERAPPVPSLPAASLSPPAAPALTSPQPPRAPSAPVTQQAATIPSSASTGGGLAKTDADIFDQLARLSQLRVHTPAGGSAPNSAPPAPSPGITSPPAISSYNNPGLGGSPAPPLGPHPSLSLPIQAQQTGLLPPPAQSGPRGPFAPVPANQGLLAPLVPTSTGFTGFVPTRPATSPSFLGTQPTGLQPQPTGFQGFAPQPTGFQPSSLVAPQPTGFQPNLAPQQTGFQPSLVPQPTGFGGGSPFGGQLGGVPPVPSLPGSFHQNGSFGQLQPRQSSDISHLHNKYCFTDSSPFFFLYLPAEPTGFNPGFGQPSYGNGNGFGGPAPPQQQGGSGAQKDTNPANVFAAMKAGTFANDSAPQSAGEAFLHAVDRGRAS